MIGEEGASRPSATGRTWVIDPVDGTYNFSQGSDYFCSALALVDDNSAHTPAIGAVHRPATDTTWIAADGVATGRRAGSRTPPVTSAAVCVCEDGGNVAGTPVTSAHACVCAAGVNVDGFPVTDAHGIVPM